MGNSKLRELQLEELRILKEFLEIVKEYKLRYFMLGGTLLGAVRHKGFIPWDDDIDIGMPREDYEKFIKKILERKMNKIKFKNFNYSDEVNIYFSRMESEKIKIYDNSAITKKIERWAWIDIFPLDGVPNNIFVRQLYKFKMLRLRLLLQYSMFSKIVNQNLPNRPIHEKLLIEFGKLIPFEKFLDKKKYLKLIDINLKKYKYNNSNYVINCMGIYKFKEMFSKKIYDEIQEYKFENLELIGPKNYDFVLKQLYGDYMKLPPEKDRNKHHTELIKE